MATNLFEISELVWRQVTGGNDETKLLLEEVDAAARLEYAWQMLQMAWRDKAQEGEWIVPSYLSREAELEIKNNEADISKLPILNSIPAEMYIQQVGGLCDCVYTKTTINNAQLFCDDDSLPEGEKTYYILGNKIKFPKGAHAEKLPIIYANDGSDLDSKTVQIDDAIGALVRQSLLTSYLGKQVAQDVTNNSSSND